MEWLSTNGKVNDDIVKSIDTLLGVKFPSD